MPSPYELVQMINRQFGVTQQQTIEEVNDLIETIDNDPKKFTYELAEELEEFSLKINKCPLCGSNIVQIRSNSESSEYFGQPVQEEIIRYGCEISSCSYIKE